MAASQERFVVASDNSKFVGRVYDLSIVALHFDSYDDASRHPDVKYVLDVNDRTSLLTSRIESLNHVGDLLWPEKLLSVNMLPISAYEYCNFIQDAFLMRIISVLDCCSLLAVEVLEIDIPPRRTNVASIRKLAPESPCCDKLEKLSNLQNELRIERNIRFHRAEEESLTDDDQVFKIAALFSHRGQGIDGSDRHGRKIDLQEFYRQAIGHLRAKFNLNVEELSRSLDGLYESLSDDFERRFKVKCNEPSAFMAKFKR